MCRREDVRAKEKDQVILRTSLKIFCRDLKLGKVLIAVVSMVGMEKICLYNVYTILG